MLEFNITRSNRGIDIMSGGSTLEEQMLKSKRKNCLQREVESLLARQVASFQAYVYVAKTPQN